MKKTTLLILIVMSIVFLQTASSCNTPTQKQSFDFLYYPSKNVYYNPATKSYFYSLDGGKNWDSTRTDLANTSALGEGKSIHTTTAEVWKENDQHRKAYNGVLYNLSSEDTTPVSLANGVSDKKEYRKGGLIKKKEAAKREKTKFGRFIDKIFGRKKKEKEKE